VGIVAKIGLQCWDGVVAIEGVGGDGFEAGDGFDKLKVGVYPRFRVWVLGLM
jgi:hypothetical protein